MLRELYKYLVLNDHVGIPGVGSFTVEKKPATFDGTSFNPPLQQLKFEPGTALTDKSFYYFLAHEKNISEVDAVRGFQDFAYRLRNNIQQHSFVELTGLGTFRKDHSGTITFEPNLSNDYFTPVTPKEVTIAKHDDAPETPGETVTEEYLEDEVVERDRWWIWATVLAILALAAIGYFYMQNQ